MMIDRNRATGRTFRMLLDAMKALSEGKYITIVAHSKDYAGDLKGSVLDMMSQYISEDYVIDCKKRIKVMGAREYSRTDLDRVYRGIKTKGQEVFFDHY